MKEGVDALGRVRAQAIVLLVLAFLAGAFAGGAIEMNPSISGRRIKSCIPIHDPNETPAIQHARASGLIDCAQSSADAASDNSPVP